MNKKLWEILVPTIRNNGRPFRTRSSSVGCKSERDFWRAEDIRSCFTYISNAAIFKIIVTSHRILSSKKEKI